MIGIPESFARSTEAREGIRGHAWIAGLPAVVDDLLQRWNCTPAGSVRHGHVGIVVPVRRGGKERAALKVSFPHPGNVHEPVALAAWDGRGAVRLHERDDALFALLLEWARPESLEDAADVDEAVAIAGRLARSLAVPAPPGLPRLRDESEARERELLEEAARLSFPLPRRVLDAAALTFRELGPDQPDTVVHGDLHFTNILRADREPWLCIDPKGYAGDPAYETVTLLRSRTEALTAATDPKAALLRRIAVFADAAGVDRDKARRWAQARAVEGALWGRAHGDPAWLLRHTDQIAELLV